MASFENDFRFARPPDKASSSNNAAEDDDEPIFGGEDSFLDQQHPGPSNWRKRFRQGFDDDDNLNGNLRGVFPNGRPPSSEDTPFDESFQAGPSKDENTELYAILNLDKDASTQDVLRSYRALAVSFHPDKHKQEHLKSAAESRFQQIQHAYEVLSNPQKRAVYDLLGEEGLKTEWEVGQKLKSPEELRAEYEKARLQRAQADIENLIRSRTEATISLDASRVVDPNGTVVQALAALPAADVRQLFMKASTMSVLSPSTQVTYSGSMLARRNAGGGNILATLKHQYSPNLKLEVGTTLLQPRILNTKATYTFGDDSFITAESSIRKFDGPPPLNITYGRKVTKSLTGFAKLTTGTSYSFLALIPGIESIPFLQPRSGSVSNLTLGVAGSSYSVDITTDQFLDGQVSANYGNIRLLGTKQHGWKLSTSVGVSFTGAATINLNTDKKLTDNTSLGLGLGAGVIGSSSLTLRLRLSRLGQRITMPIILSPNASARLVVSTVLLPSISIASLQYFYLTPRRRKRIAEKLKELREEAKEQNEAKRKAALEAMELLSEQVARKREIELSRDGLVILEAKYRGAGRHLDPNEIKESELDVTVAVQALVASSQSDKADSQNRKQARDSTLIIPGGRSKSNIIGFYDILVGSKKELAITYLFKGRRHFVIYDDYASVALPMRSHLVE
ncbi:hypothetical protein P389DRAFT_163971 [Cystobasidium minutum MCA 4210]|uniref:uncharacterized protein n=1 Tax=Cystobasidium minutum MCA 4210 TaxID=1397322 RepID=UPI0034CFAAEB|eukprot:jgi/Rhomi1/163971/estExt_Genewise1Plus.C_90243